MKFTMHMIMAQMYDTVEFVDEEYIKDVTKRLEGLYLNRILCDVIVNVGRQRFPAHRNVLAASSGYFLTLFEEQTKWGHEEKLGSTTEVHISNIGENTISLVLRYIYTGEIRLCQSNVESILHCAKKLQLPSLMRACCSYFVNTLDIQNCLSVLSFSTVHSYDELQKVVFQFAQQHFFQLSTTSEFLDASPGLIALLFSSDDLNIDKEENIFEALIKWTYHDLGNRRDLFPQLLALVRLPLLSPYFLVDVVENEELVAATPSCRDLLRSAQHYHLLPSRRAQNNSAFTRPRKHQRWAEKLVSVGAGSTFCYDLPTGKWDELQNLPRVTAYHGLVAVGKDIYVIGGFSSNNSETLNSILRYDADKGLWGELPPLNFRRSKAAVAEVDGYVYVIGGYDGFATINSVERFGINSATRENLEPMPSRRSCTCAVSYTGSIHVIGGHNGSNILNTIESFDTATKTWSSIQIQPMRERRSFPCGVVCGDRMFVLGGYDGHETLRAVEEYNFTTHQWRQAKPMLVARSNAGAAVWNEKLYVVGGWDGRALNAVERFDVTKDEWELLKSLPRPTTGVRCCFLSSKTLNDSCEPLDDSNLLSIENSHQALESNDRALGRGVLCALTFAAGVISGYAIKKWQMWFAV